MLNLKPEVVQRLAAVVAPPGPPVTTPVAENGGRSSRKSASPKSPKSTKGARKEPPKAPDSVVYVTPAEPALEPISEKSAVSGVRVENRYAEVIPAIPIGRFRSAILPPDLTIRLLETVRPDPQPVLESDPIEEPSLVEFGDPAAGLAEPESNILATPSMAVDAAESEFEEPTKIEICPLTVPQSEAPIEDPAQMPSVLPADPAPAVQSPESNPVTNDPAQSVPMVPSDVLVEPIPAEDTLDGADSDQGFSVEMTAEAIPVAMEPAEPEPEPEVVMIAPAVNTTMMTVEDVEAAILNAEPVSETISPADSITAKTDDLKDALEELLSQMEATPVATTIEAEAAIPSFEEDPEAEEPFEEDLVASAGGENGIEEPTAPRMSMADAIREGGTQGPSMPIIPDVFTAKSSPKIEDEAEAEIADAPELVLVTNELAPIPSMEGLPELSRLGQSPSVKILNRLKSFFKKAA